MSATSPLLQIPKKGTADVDFGPTIRQIITATYSEAPERYSEEIAQLNRTRQDAVRSSTGSETTALQLLHRYFGQLELLELRFPEIRVPFPWNDAFMPSKSVSQLSLAYEKASVIFNIAATLSCLAASQNRSSPEGLKRSFNYYRSAAGMFTYINDNFLHAPSTDLGRDLVKVLVTLMTAQATEVFLERMNEEKRSPGLKSKICAQVAAIYTAIIEDVKEHVGKAIFDRSWLILVQAKAKYFSSVAQFNRSLTDAGASKHGEALARLTIAETTAKEALRLSQMYGTSFYIGSPSSAASTLPIDAGSSLQELCKNLSTIISEARTAAIKDNDLIYHSLVPSEAALPIIERSANVAEPIPIQEIYASPDVQKLVGQDIFIKLVPLSVIESSSMYSEEKAKILRTEGERCDVADGELTTGLDHLGLPGSLAKFKSGTNQDMGAMTDPGGQVNAWSLEIRTSEEERRLEAYIGELTQVRERTIADLDWSSAQLDNEQKECENARVRFDHLFEQSSSGTHTRSWRTDIKNDREALVQAKASDDQVLSLWASVREDVGLLSAGQEALVALFANTIARIDAHESGNGRGSRSLLDLDLPDEEGDQLNRNINAIQEALSKLFKLKKERTDVLADLKERIHNDDISQLLILNRKAQNVEPALFAAELEKFRPHQARIAATVQSQQNALMTINREWERLTGARKGREIQDRYAKADRAKKELILKLKKAYETYRETRAGVAKGTEFYRELSELAATLRSEVSQFVSSRANERSSIISNAELRQRFSGNIDGNSLGKSFDAMNLSSSSLSRSPVPAGSARPYQPVSPSRSNAYPSMSVGPGKAQTTYQAHQIPAPRPSSTYSSYSNGTSGYTTASTPSLPPKPPVQSSYPTPGYRQPNEIGLTPPTQQYAPYPQHSQHSGIPPPPSAMSYSSISSYNTAPHAPVEHRSPTSPLSSQPSYSSFQSYGQSGSSSHALPKQQAISPPHQPSYPSHSNPAQYDHSLSLHGQQGQQQDHTYNPTPSQPYRQDSRYGLPPPPPLHPSRQQNQYTALPQQQQHLYQPRF